MKMKGILSALFFVLLTVCMNAQSVKKVEHSFSATSATTLSIKNSFGDIDIEPTSGDKIDVLVTITLETKNGKKTEEYLDNIGVEVSESGNTVSLKTVNNQQGKFKVNNFSIDYQVKIPSGTHLKIDNSFGDVKIEGRTGSLDLVVKHGDCFVASADDDKNKIQVEFGDLRMGNTNDAVIKVQHGDLNIGSAATIDLAIQFGDCSIELLQGEATINIMHGDLDIDDVSSKIDLIDIDAQFSDISIEGLSNGDFVANIEVSFTDIDTNGEWVVHVNTKDYHSETLKLSTKGNDASGKHIIIKASHCDVDLE